MDEKRNIKSNVFVISIALVMGIGIFSMGKIYLDACNNSNKGWFIAKVDEISQNLSDKLQKEFEFELPTDASIRYYTYNENTYRETNPRVFIKGKFEIDDFIEKNIRFKVKEEKKEDGILYYSITEFPEIKYTSVLDSSYYQMQVKTESDGETAVMIQKRYFSLGVHLDNVSYKYKYYYE